ncbi:glycosyltransferase family 4 protein [Sporosalibacterium faouarense]|uniref:glycosyltransferase family 4 protein n=1 Tax=Sporosalibacterium faouarense TaxID=516123 RepID=UPI00141C5B90|nr:glycosyltransferase family 1 protein [Sporosalibacterium faouarense]MTI47425.1 glycosyltransferase family 1 protein [Bacillota bacterium]
MKVALFTDTFLPQINGVTKTLGKLIEHMEENDIDYRVFAPVDGDVEYNNRIIRFFSFKFFLYPDCRVSLPNYYSITKELDEFQPDIIHVVTPFNIGLWGLRYAKSRNVPLVSSYHTNIPQYLEYFKLNFLANISWEFFRWFHKHCEINYCPSQSTFILLKEEGINNLEIWDRGIDTNKFSPTHRDIEFRNSLEINDKLVFLYVGRMSPEKDLDIFMNVAKRLNQRYRDKIHFLMVGDGPMKKELDESKPDNMTFTGFIKGKELAKVYASSDIFMFPSSTETYGNVILEAMASGLPTIACLAGGIIENLKDNYNGLGCGVREENEFFNACEQLITSDDYRRNIGKNARKYTLERSWHKVFNNLFNSYNSVISKDLLDKERNKISA